MTHEQEPLIRSSAIERWLATHVAFFARRWRRRMHVALIHRFRLELELAQHQVLSAASIWMLAPHDGDVVGELMSAVCAYQNAAVQLQRELRGDEFADVLFTAFGRRPTEALELLGRSKKGTLPEGG